MKSDKEILIEAKKRFDHETVQWSETKQKTTDLVKFIAGDQWTYQARQNFENAGFTAMTSNRIPTMLRQITNEIRKNMPSIQIDPRSDADSEKAEIIGDLVRNIQEESKSEIAYCKAAENCAAVGIGYIRVTSKYISETSFDQEICIESIDDTNMVMIDSNHQSLTGSDAEYAFISTILSKDEYRRRYSKSKLAKRMKGEEVTDEDLREAGWSAMEQKWVNDDQILINEYYFKDYETKTLYQVYNNITGETSTTFDLDKERVDTGELEVIQSSQREVPIIRWCKLNDLEVLESTEWPGKHIPIIMVKGDEYWVDGKRKIIGAVEPAIETQVQLNYAMSWRAQLLQMSPKAPYIGTANQFKTYEQQWANINVSNQAFLPYNLDGNAPPPQRDLGEVPIQSASVLVQSSEDDLRSIFGTFDPANTTVAPESGKAIIARQSQSYNSNYHFYDNLARSIEQVGCVIVDAIPVIYDSSRDVQVMSLDKKKKTVSINQPNEFGVVEYDLTAGDYSVSIQTGPSFGTKRQESTEAIMDLIQAYPSAAPAIADIAARNMDWPGAAEIATSLEALVPPQVMQARKTNPKDAAAMIPQLQSQLQQLGQQNELLTTQLRQATNKMNEWNDKLQIEQLKAEVDLRKNEADAMYKMRSLKFDEEKTQLEFLIKEQELKIAFAELELQKAQIGVKATQTLSDIATTHHDKTIAHIDRMDLGEGSMIQEAKRESGTGIDQALE